MDRRTRNTLALIFGAMLLTILVSGRRGDYVAYVDQWASVLRGDVPWRLELSDEPKWNTYGPAFLAFLPVFWLQPLAPKVLFGLVWFAGYLVLAQLARQAEAVPETARRWLWGGYLLSPFYWVDTLYYGHFDVVVAWLVVGACLALRRRRESLAAVCLAASVLLKFAPLALLPVLALAQRRARVWFAALTLVLVAAGLGLAYVVWGEAAFYPLIVSARRGPKLMSLFAYLGGEYSVLKLWRTPPPAATWLSLPLMVLGALAAAALHWFKRMDLLLGAALAALVVVAFYKVGHPQFYTLPMVLLLAWLADRGFRPLADVRLARAFKAFLVWLSAIMLLYTWTGAFHTEPWPILREVLGVPAFAMDVWLVAVLVRHAWGAAETPAT